jgi:hypothetical protein
VFSGLCGPMGFTGWLVMVAVWTGLIALVVWTIARLFPSDRHLRHRLGRRISRNRRPCPTTAYMTGTVRRLREADDEGQHADAIAQAEAGS